MKTAAHRILHAYFGHLVAEIVDALGASVAASTLADWLHTATMPPEHDHVEVVYLGQDERPTRTTHEIEIVMVGVAEAEAALERLVALHDSLPDGVGNGDWNTEDCPRCGRTTHLNGVRLFRWHPVETCSGDYFIEEGRYCRRNEIDRENVERLAAGLKPDEADRLRAGYDEGQGAPVDVVVHLGCGDLYEKLVAAETSRRGTRAKPKRTDPS